MKDQYHFREVRNQYQEMFGQEPDTEGNTYSREELCAILEQCIARKKTYSQLRRRMKFIGFFTGKSFDRFVVEWVAQDND